MIPDENYAFFLENGIGVVQDRAVAGEYYQRAMEAGHSNARTGYGRCRQ
jgi:TPR repeat protein